MAHHRKHQDHQNNQNWDAQYASPGGSPLDRQAVHGETQKNGQKCMCRLAAHELPPGDFWKIPETLLKMREKQAPQFYYDSDHTFIK